MTGDTRTDDRPTVLIVDDEEETADLFAEFLDGDYATLTAYGGEEALDRLTADVDVVLLDRSMPGTTGDEVLSTIRDRGVDCRVVMVTAVEPNTDVIDLDFDEYLVKPVSRETLIDAVERMLVRKSHDHELQEVFAIASKMATLESKMDIDDLESSEKYATLERRFAEHRASISRLGPDDDLYAELSAVKMRALFDTE